jgi:hypothetical protein
MTGYLTRRLFESVSETPIHNPPLDGARRGPLPRLDDVPRSADNEGVEIPTSPTYDPLCLRHARLKPKRDSVRRTRHRETVGMKRPSLARINDSNSGW